MLKTIKEFFREKKKILLQIFLGILILFGSYSIVNKVIIGKEVPQTIEWLDNCQVRKVGDKYNTIIGRTFWVNDSDGKCKPIEKAKSLKNSPIKCIVKKDKPTDPDVECLDYNLTWVKLDVKDKVKKYKIKIYEEGNKSKIKLDKDKKTLDIVELNINFSDEIHIGENSTTVMLQDANTENLDDNYVNEQYPTYNYPGDSDLVGIRSYYFGGGRNERAFIKFNISSIPVDMVIKEALLVITCGQSGATQRTYDIYNASSSWTEESIIWNNQPSHDTLFDSELSNVAVGGTTIFNVTSSIPSPYVLINNITYMIKDQTEDSGTSYSYYFASKEHATVSYRVYLNITYTQPDTDNDGIIDAIDKCPTSNQTGDCIEVNSYGCCIDGEGDTLFLQEADTDNLKDAYVVNTFPGTGNNNYGTQTKLCIQLDSYGSDYRSYIQFNISLIPDGQQIDASSLNLYAYTGSQRVTRIHHVYNGWINGTGSNELGETTITNNNQPCGINFDNSANCNLVHEDNLTVDAFGWWSWNVTNALKTDYGNRENVSFVGRLDSETGSLAGYCYYSKEYTTDVSLRPFLNITYSPELPSIFDEQWNETSVSLGTQVTGSANVTHSTNDIDTVKFEVMYPNGTRVNFTGTNLQGSGGEATTCYQETANVSTGCGGLSTGKYYQNGNWNLGGDKVINGDWSDTEYDAASNGNIAYYWINYTKPSTATDSSLWQVMDNDNGKTNVSIPNSCWSETPLQLRVESYTNIPTTFEVSWSCYNGTDFEDILTTANTNEVVEEAMWWNLSTSSGSDKWVFNITDTSQIGIYNLTRVWANDTDGNEKSTYPYITFNVMGGPDTNWTIYDGNNYIPSETYKQSYYITFRASPNTNNNEPEDQSAGSSICLFKVQNNGTATGDVKISINDTLTDITVKADDDYTSAGATTLSTTPQVIHASLAADSDIEICLWADYGASPVGKQIDYNVTVE